MTAGRMKLSERSVDCLVQLEPRWFLEHLRSRHLLTIPITYEQGD
jgi:hypothetical protein